MPCKIQIKQNITDVVEEKTNHVLDSEIGTANSVAESVNEEFDSDVVSFTETQEGIERDIHIPADLVDIYYDHELTMESEELIGDTDAMLQLDEMNASIASAETVSKMKEAAKQMGINFQHLEEYVRENPAMDVSGASGVADLAKGTIAIAQGRENYALTEEVVHMATAIMEQTNPKLVTALISKIGNYKIYNTTLQAYKGNKNYQLADGKPDIRKIKKEAVDKLIAEVIVYNSENVTEFPELRSLTIKGEILSWWDTIMNGIRSIFGKSKVDVFNQAAEQITEGTVGNVSDITMDGIYLQTARKTNKVVDAHYDKIIEEDSKMILHDKVEGDRHYTRDGVRIDTTVTEKVKKGKTMPDRTPEEKIIDEQKKKWGDEGHKFIDRYITANLIDADGYALAKPLKEPIDTKLDDAVQSQLRIFCKNLIKSYPPNTRFLLEKKVVNTKVKGMIGSTVDFKALIPITKADGTEDMKIDTLDWKFTTIDKSREEDIPWFKQKDWVPQMREYVEMDYAYGATASQTRKARMIPFIVNYDNRIKGNHKSGLVPRELEIGKLDSTQETNLYLLPVPLNTETTGNEEVDKLVQSLQSQWDKLWETHVDEEHERQKKTLDLNELSKAIRHLHLKLDFEPLRKVGITFLNNANDFISSFDKIDLDALNKEELNSLLHNVVSYKDSSLKYSELDKAFLTQIDEDSLTKEDRSLLSSFRNISRSTDNMLDKLQDFEKQVVASLGVKQGIVSEQAKMSILEAEAAIDTFSASFKEASKLPSKIINLASSLIMKASEVTKRKTSKQIREFGKVLLPLEEEARARGKKAFDMIGNIEDGKMSLFKKLSTEFWDSVKEAKEAGNRKFFLNNVNKQEFYAEIDEAIKKGVEDLEKREYDVDPQTAEVYRDAAIERLHRALDIRRVDFNGFQNKSFSYYFSKHIKEEGNYSKEYEEMSKSKAALDVWNYFTELNRGAKKMGYLTKQGTSFFPLIEATTLEKFYQTSDHIAQTKDFFRDFYTITVNEENQYSKIDPETGKVKKQIPKYFTKSNKEVNQLSTDLNKVGSLWIQAINEYENSKDMEYTLMTLEAVERGKGSLVMENGNIVMDRGKAKVDYSDTKNAQLLQTVIDDAVYNIGEDLNSFMNVGLSSVTGKFSKDEEGKQEKVVAVKKAIKNADTLVQALAVGLKPLISVANWMGVQFQAFMNGKNMYSYTDFQKNNFRVCTGQLSTIERGLLDLIHPLNEDITLEERRKLAKKQGLSKYLSTWSFTDVMMSTNAFPERKLQYANAVSFNENSMVVDGKIVGIRQHLKAQDAKQKYEKDADGKYVMSEQDRKALESTYNDRVQALKESSSLPKIAKIENDEVVIPGVTEEALAEYSLKIKEYMRELNGQMNPDNKAGYRRDTMFSSFMMFKNWIPKLISVRTLDIQKNVQLGEWQYGRSRAFLKTAVHLGIRNIMQMQDIINGTEAGLKILDELLQAKKDDHFRRTGQVLEITQEEFNDLIRTQLQNQVNELMLVLGTIIVVFAAGVAVPPDDATDQEKNLFKWTIKAINKISDEVLFFYNPISFETMTSGRLLPSVGILSKSLKILQQLSLEGYGYATDDDEMVKKAHGLKYTLNLIPGLAQFQTEVLPYLYPELAKEMGIRVTEQSRLR